MDSAATHRLCLNTSWNILGITVSKKELLGLLIVFIVYVLMGGVIFMLLESPLEEQLRRELAELRDEFHEKLILLENKENVTRLDMESLMLRLAAAHSSSLIDEEGNDTHTNWSFENSFFFAITVVTTIGYGHLSPSTTPGRVFCVLYATVGIPLTGILLAAIGGHYSEHLVKKLQRAKKSRNSRWAVVLTASTCMVPWLLVFLVLPAGMFTFTEGWSFVESVYYCFITLSTIGFGDYVAGNFRGQYIWFYKIGVVLWIIFGLGYLAMILNYISRAMRCKQVRRVERKLSSSFYHTQQRVGHRLEEVCSILHDISRHRAMKPRNRALKRIQSFPAPEFKDQNHNHKIQRLLNMAENLKAEEVISPFKQRRHSLPLPDPPIHLEAATLGRGSLQVFTDSKETPKLANGYPSRSNPAQIFGLAQLTSNRTRSRTLVKRGSAGRIENDWVSNRVIDVVAENRLVEDIFPHHHAVLDMEGLQCTRV